MIVSEIAGTTRDSIDIRFEVDGKAFVAIDTPGVRKKKSLANDIEFYGLVRAQRSIRRADLVLMFFDATETISKVDKQLVEEISEHYKPCIFVINKWDRAMDQEMTTDKWSKYLTDAFSSMRHVPIAIITAKDGKNIRKLLNLARSVYKQANARMSTGRLNKAVRMAIDRNPPPIRSNRRPKIFFASQVAGAPPTIVLKCNEPALLDESWKRYLLGFLREVTPFQEVPIRLILRGRNESEEELGGGSRRQEVEPPELTELTDDQMLDPTEDAEALEQALDDLESDDLLTLEDDVDVDADDDDGWDDEVKEDDGA